MNAFVNPDNELAVNKRQYILNPDIFFSGWGSFGISLILMAKAHKQLLGTEGCVPPCTDWIGLAVAIFVTMSSAIQIWQDIDCNDRDEDLNGEAKYLFNEFCSQSTFAILLGLVSGVMLVGMVVLVKPIMLQTTSILLLIAWCFGVAYITYDNGLATSIGILCFAI